MKKQPVYFFYHSHIVRNTNKKAKKLEEHSLLEMLFFSVSVLHSFFSTSVCLIPIKNLILTSASNKT